MEEFMKEMAVYMTMENVLYFIGATIIFSVVLFLIKQVSKMLAFVVLLGVIYYFGMASPETKQKVNQCMTESIDNKEISPLCKKIFE